MKSILITAVSFLLVFSANTNAVPPKEQCKPGTFCECPKGQICKPKPGGGSDNAADVYNKGAGKIVQPNAQGRCAKAPAYVQVNLFGKGTGADVVRKHHHFCKKRI